MTVRITAAQARALGVDPKIGRTRTVKRAVKGTPYHTQCVTCGEEFTIQAAEDRHLAATRHFRYRLLP